MPTELPALTAMDAHRTSSTLNTTAIANAVANERQHNLFTEAEQKQLQLFLDGLDERDDLATTLPHASSSSLPQHQHQQHQQHQQPIATGSKLQRQPKPQQTSTPRKRPFSDTPEPVNKIEKRRVNDQQKVGSPKREASLSPSLSESDSGSHLPCLDGLGSDKKPAPRARGGGRGRKPTHELLTEDQKKANHIASEQKRRANIRIGFDQLVDSVPTLSHCQRSESLILQKSADYIRQLLKVKNELRERSRELQTVLGETPDEDSSDEEADYTF